MTKVRTWLVVGVLGVLVVVVAGWFVLISPQKSKASSVRTQVAEQQQANARLRSQVRVLQAQRSALPSEQARIAAIQKKIPDTPGLPSYIRFLTEAASATHVELVSVAPSAPTKAQLNTPAPSATPSASAAASSTSGSAAAPAAGGGGPGQAQDLSVVTLSISVIGDYFSIQQFLSKLEHAERSTLVTSVSLAPGTPLQPAQAPGGTTSSAAPGDTAGSQWRTLQANINAAIFVSSSLAGPSATPQPEPAASGGAAS